MKSSKKFQISSHLLFVYINNQDGKWRMSVLVFSSALVYLYETKYDYISERGWRLENNGTVQIVRIC